ncbi:MAG: carboxypeptidase-like regulatory domain-containing protein, partial [Vicinamibacterales bacterium]
MGTTGASAQGSFFSSLSGTVVDASGAVIPGATVKVQNNGTGSEVETISGADGGFNVPSLAGGNYSVTVTLMGFKTAILKSVTVNAGIPAQVKVTLELGALSENITVVGESATVVHSQSPAISTNITGQQITSLPLTSRNALDSLTALAGFNTSGAARSSTVSGLPRSAINITLDGMSVQDNYLKTTDGYFARLSPLLDSVEEVTVTTAGNTAGDTGQGAVQIRFVTKSGTNSWNGTAYEYLRHDALNANTWFRNRDLPPDAETGKAPKDKLRQYQQGFAQGGPIIRNKSFFFFNYEELRSPAESTLQRVILTPSASSGIFSYNAGGGVQNVNLLQIAAANGQLATIDPTVAKVLANIQAATTKSGGVSALNNPLVQQYTWSTPTTNFNPSPTARVDYEITKSHRLTGSVNYRHINSTPDTTNSAQLPFPNALQTGSQQSTRWTTSESLRSTFGSSLVNEFRVGASGGATLFSPEFESNMWSDTNGYRLNLNGACCGTGAALTNWSLGSGQSSREASTKVVENTTTWLKGNHNVSLGGSFVETNVWLQNQTLVPTANFGLLATEAADGIFNTTTLPGASAADVTQAKNLYAILTGRITSLTGDARITPDGSAYVPLGLSRAEGRTREVNFFVADSWRMSPSVTISAGLRYVMQNPFYPTNESYSTVTEAGLYGKSGVGNLFMPGTLTGARSGFVQYPSGTYAYNVDRNNFAPSLGFAWQLPPSDNAIGRLFMGAAEGDSVIRAGAAMAFQRPGMSDFTGVFGANQGISVNLTRDSSNVIGSFPMLLRNANQMALPAAPSASRPIFPTAITNSVNMFDANLQNPYTQSYTVGWQRKLGRDTAFELRYVGSRHRQDWETVNLNEVSITDNGFVQEFRKAQANLQANIAAGRGATFAYTGVAGTSPLPTFLAFFQGLPSGQAGSTASYTSTQFTNATNLGFLAAQNPNPFGFASTNSTSGFVGNAGFRANGITAGLPANFFLANPDVLGGTANNSGGANLTTNFGGTRANSMQFEFRKRLSNGVAFSTSYAWASAWMMQRYGFQHAAEEIAQAGQVGNVQHAVKGNWIYELPFGEGKRWGGHSGGVINVLLGGWEFDGVGRIQTGEQIDFGNVRLVGMSEGEFRKSVELRVASNGQLFILPQDIIDNTVKAFQTSATTANGYGALGAPTGRYLAPANGPDCLETSPGSGDCGIRTLVANAPRLVRFDLSMVKRVKIRGNVNFEFRAEMLNALNSPYFNIATTGGQPLGVTTSYYGPGGPYANFNNGSYPAGNAVSGASADSLRLIGLLGDNSSRIIQLV